MSGVNLVFKNKHWMLSTPNIDPQRACDPFFNTVNSIMLFQVCSIILLQKKLNFTLVQGATTLPSNVNTGIICHYRVLLQYDVHCLSHVPRTDHYGFIIIHKDARHQETQTRITGILFPFGIYVTVLLFLSSLSIAGAISGVELGTWNAKHAIRLWSQISKLLLDQSSKMVFKKESHVVVITLWGIWAAVWLTVSQIYRGEIFTSLSFKFNPEVPTDIKNLLEDKNKVHLASFENTCTDQNGNLLFCVTDLILPNTLAALSHQGQKEKYDLYESFGKLVYRLGFDAIELLLFCNNGLGLSKIVNQTTSQKLFLEADKFGIVERTHSLELFSEDFLSYSDFWVSKLNPIPMFKWHGFILVWGKRHAEVLDRFLAKLETGGFPTRIREWGEAVTMSIYMSFHYPKRRLMGQGEAAKMKAEVRRKYLFCLEGCSSRNEKVKIRFSTISKDVYFAILRYWLGCLSVGLLVFCGEMASVFAKRDFVHFVAFKNFVGTGRSWLVNQV